MVKSCTIIAGALNVGMGRLEEAVAHYDQAVALAPDFIEALNNRGAALLKLQRLELALASFDEAIRLQPHYADPHINRAIALGKLQRSEQALAAFDRGIRLDPNRPEAYNNRGNLFLRQHRLRDALRDYDKALQLQPAFADAFLNRGNALKLLQRPEDAVASYDRAIALAPALVQAHGNRGTVLRTLKRPEEALTSLREALRLKPDYAVVYAELLDLEAHLCCWADRARDDALLAGASGDEAVSPFHMLHLTDDPRRQRDCARAWAAAKFGGIQPGDFRRGSRGDKIRVGYFSADFHNHATMYLMARLFELHDRKSFEIHAFSYGRHSEDEMRSRLVNAVDEFHDVADRDDREVAKLAGEKAIDIAVDLKGYTEDARPGIFAYRPAPVQVSYLGYPGTMGADFFDYIIGDAVTIPPGSQDCYSEKIVHLPHSYQVNDDRRRISGDVISRADVGLPEDGFIFCCFNNNYKISPDEFDIWMRLLRKVDRSVLWLLRDTEIAADNLRREAQARDVDPARLVFADRVPLDHHLARHRCADLFLDTFNYNAHTTASDALWAGVPVLTKLGSSFAARVAGSLLHALDVPELVTDTKEDYEALALALATQPERLAVLKHKIAGHRISAPLFNAEKFTRDIEAAYLRLYGAASARTERGALERV